ncbi:MAG TPA: universal stress protein, partial [Steroidobacteraceae bacterium]|nr:universal stress protein [Steroidobacteraceae bacterium]
ATPRPIPDPAPVTSATFDVMPLSITLRIPHGKGTPILWTRRESAVTCRPEQLRDLAAAESFMKTPRRILVAVKDPGSRKQSAVHKAAQLAAGCNARLELFHAIGDPVYLDAFLLQGMSLEQTQRQWSDRIRARLERLAARLRASGLKVDVAVEWDFPAYDAIIRRTTRTGADLIVAERHATRHMLPWLLRFNDWELLRRSPTPVLLVKSARPWRKPAVLAAIDPSHSFAKPARLDGGILESAQQLNSLLGGKLHVAHAWAGTPQAIEPLDALAAEMTIALDRDAARQARRTFTQTVDKARLRSAQKHFVAGQAVDVIPQLARKLGASIVVMGAISRSGVKRLVIGNVAEQVLDALPCDVLVVKPANFKAPVKGRARGVRLVPTPAYV